MGDLCPQCSRIVSGETYTNIRRTPYPFEGGVTNDYDSFPHHDSLGSFESAVKEQCPVCCRVLLKQTVEMHENEQGPYTRYRLVHDNQGRKDELNLQIICPQATNVNFTFHACPSTRKPVPDRLRVPQTGYKRYIFENPEDERVYEQNLSNWFEENTPNISQDDCDYCRNLTLEPLPLSTCSTQMFEKANFWLQTCLSMHPECQYINYKDYTLPTRLIDIGECHTSRWRVRLCAEEIPSGARYVTLSHRWGPSDFLRLQTNNIENLRSGLSMEDLPSTFRDAVSITRALNVQYIWIDSLCVIQDSDADWEKESSMMCHVYRNGLCNIVAASSDSPYDGLFRERNSILLRSFDFHTSWTHDLACNTHFDGYERDTPLEDLKNIPLFSRGWVFQERLLSPRLLIFTNRQVYWNCRSRVASETRPNGLENALKVEIPHHDSFLFLSMLETSDSDFNVLFRDKGEGSTEMWHSLLTPFLGCKLSYSKDRLAALQGVAKFVQEKTGDQYLAGLWREGFPHMLCWRVKGDGPHEKQPEVAPSWSWASIRDDDTIDLTLWGTGVFTTRHELATLTDITSDSDIEEVCSHPEGSLIAHMEGRLLAANLRSRNGGNVGETTWTLEVVFSGDVSEISFNSHAALSNAICLDRGSNLCGDLPDIYLLPLLLHDDFASGKPRAEQIMVHGLILERSIARTEGNLRRIGCFRFPDPHIGLAGMAREVHSEDEELAVKERLGEKHIYSFKDREDRSQQWHYFHIHQNVTRIQLV